LINNASSFYPTTLAETTAGQWDDLMGSNLRAPYFLLQALAPALSESRGAVVNIVDVYAERPLPGYGVYSMAKAGLVMLTKSMALELAPEVRVNAVAPGAILWPDEANNGFADEEKTAVAERLPLARKGEPEDIAAAVMYLLKADYVTGQILPVDGGRTLLQ
jgi:pteridine reductase